MKLLTSGITLKRDKKLSFICLETIEDVAMFRAVDERIRAKEAIKFWMGFKSQSFKSTPMDYCCHYCDSPIATILATRLQFAESETSLVQYCAMADKLFAGFYKDIANMIRGGYFVRVNWNGSITPIGKDLSRYTVKDTDESILYNKFYSFQNNKLYV